MDLINIRLWDRVTPVREYRTIENLLNNHNTTLDTMHNIWICLTFHGQLLWSFHDEKDEITEENKNELHKRFRHSRERLTAIAGDWLDNLMRIMVRQKGYSTIESCISYLHGKNKQWKADARYLLDLREQVYEKAFEFLSTLSADEGGVFLVDFSDAPLLAALPEIKWPE